MKRIVIITVSALLILGVNSNAQFKPEQKPMKETSESISRFAFDLMKKLEKDKNAVFSPFSISVALAMTSAGAAGETQEEINKTFHFDKVNDLHDGFYKTIKGLEKKESEGLELHIANSLWMEQDYSFLPDYLHLVENKYGSSLHSVDFRSEQGRTNAMQDINKWVSKNTEEMIEELITPGMLTPLTRLVLANAIYFYGKWKHPFDEEMTYQGDFTVKEGETVRTDFMNITERYKYMQDELVQCVEIPYEGDGFSLAVILPKEPEGLDYLMEHLDYEYYIQLETMMMYEEVDLHMPKFKAEYYLPLQQILMEMGMVEAFSNGADFSNMTGTRDLQIDKVIHKAVFEVNEEGTEAAGATAVVMMEKSAMPRQEILFRADHPFIYLIRDNETGNVLFIGKMLDPSAD